VENEKIVQEACNGDERPTEAHSWRDLIAAWLYGDEHEFTGWNIFQFEDQRTTLFLAVTVTGMARYDLAYDFVGVFEDYEQARTALQSRGYLDEEDFKERWSA
jgi:hypothetical protein